jgi:transcription antitermination factor NusA-like protein
VRLASVLTGYDLDIETKQAEAKPEKRPRKNIEDDLLSAVEEVSGE